MSPALMAKTESFSKQAMKLSCLIVTGLILAVAHAHAAAGDEATSFETPPVLQAKELAPATLLAGQGFQVNEAVPTDGLTAIFTIHSNVGTFQARGLEMHRIRVAELPAIQELEQTSKTKVFAQSLAKIAFGR